MQARMRNIATVVPDPMRALLALSTTARGGGGDVVDIRHIFGRLASGEKGV
jgi:hypothetical protein